jgi:hypothetical protein
MAYKEIHHNPRPASLTDEQIDVMLNGTGKVRSPTPQTIQVINIYPSLDELERAYLAAGWTVERKGVDEVTFRKPSSGGEGSCQSFAKNL